VDLGGRSFPRNGVYNISLITLQYLQKQNAPRYSKEREQQVKRYSIRDKMPLRPCSRSVPMLFKPSLYNIRLYSTPTSTLKVTSVPAPHAGSIRIVSLNRPTARNAISRQVLSELRKQVDEVSNEPEDGPTRALILASESDQAFCAGADLKERLTMSGQE
jgi:hypothetical protein